ncbi:MAG: hypothetical protein AABZ47_12595 [Planctomycetota bacterium]
MVRKQSLVTLLVIANAVLLLALISQNSWLASAWAQARGSGGGDYVCVTAKANGQSYDVLYVLDSDQKRLHAFFPPNIQTRELVYAQSRDLKQDFPRP